MTIGPAIPYRARETIASFVSRTAAYFGVNAATFAADKETSFSKLIEGSSEAVGTLLNFNVSLPEDVISWSPTSDGMVKRNRLFRQQIFPSRALQKSKMRGCPECLRDDLEGPSNPELSMAMRGHWLVPHVTLCLKHQLPLVTLWQESKSIARFDSAVFLADRHVPATD